MTRRQRNDLIDSLALLRAAERALTSGGMKRPELTKIMADVEARLALGTHSIKVNGRAPVLRVVKA